MTEIIVAEKRQLPLATQKTKDGVEFYWVEELRITGVSQRGLAKLLGCDDSVIRNAIASFEGAEEITPLAVEILTDGGLQGADFLTSFQVVEILEIINFSKVKLVTRKTAYALTKRLANAGFNFLVMAELAPQQLAKKAVENARVKQLEEKLLEFQAENQELRDAYGKLAIAGTQPTLIPQTIDSVDQLTEAVRRRNLAEMEAVGTPGTTQYERAKTVSRGLRFGWKR